jgi:hypothetical protein
MIYICCNIDIINIALLYNYKQTKTNKHETVYNYRNHFRRYYSF